MMHEALVVEGVLTLGKRTVNISISPFKLPFSEKQANIAPQRQWLQDELKTSVALETRNAEINIIPVNLPERWKQENIALREERQWLQDELKGLVESISIYKDIFKKETDILKSKKRLLEITLARVHKKHNRELRNERRKRKWELRRLKRAFLIAGAPLSPSTQESAENISIVKEFQKLTFTSRSTKAKSAKSRRDKHRLQHSPDRHKTKKETALCTPNRPLQFETAEPTPVRVGSGQSIRTSALSSPSNTWWSKDGAWTSDCRIFSPNSSPIIFKDEKHNENKPSKEEQRCFQQLSDRARGGERLGFQQTIEAVKFLAHYREKSGVKSPQAIEILTRARSTTCTEDDKLTPIAGFTSVKN